MLVDGEIIKKLLSRYGIIIRGAIHIGAHECEEKGFYNNILGLNDSKIIWVDGNENKVNEMKSRGHQNVYNAVLDEDEKDIIFNITNNTQASSILKLNHDEGFYRDINITSSVACRTEKLSSFLKRIEKDSAEYNFWNLDIQGSELHVLRGSKELLENCDAIYTEVNLEHVYNGCGLIQDIDKLLEEYGFIRVETKWTDMKWGDALYLKSKSLN
jgi:FkbM family methyltransferase